MIRAPFFRFVLFALLAVVCAACAAKTPPPTLQEQETAWISLRRQAEQPLPEALLTTGSLFYATGERKGRVTFTAWGNLPFPVRADISASIGSQIALWREDEKGVLLYLPQERTAWRLSSAREGMRLLDLDIPFSLRDILLMIAGRTARLLPPTYSNASFAENEVLFTFDRGNIRSVRTARDGRILALEGSPPAPWSMVLAYAETGLPERIGIVSSRGEAAIKPGEIQFRDVLWPPLAFELTLPPETQYRTGVEQRR